MPRKSESPKREPSKPKKDTSAAPPSEEARSEAGARPLGVKDFLKLKKKGVTLGVVTIMFGVLLSGMGTIGWMTVTAGTKLAVIETRMKMVEDDLKEAKTDIKDVLKKSLATDATTTHAPAPHATASAQATP